MNSSSPTITILGAGSWGTALGLYLARQNISVKLWSNESEHIKTLIQTRTNERFLPGYVFPETLRPEFNFNRAIENADIILIAVPSHAFRSVLEQLKPLFNPHQSILCATKGLDAHSNQLFHEVASEILGKKIPFAILAGPSFAREVAAGLPTAVVIASQIPLFAKQLSELFNTSIFRIYRSTDIIGVEIGGVVKNVLAIATGISDGMQFGANARSALITRGLSEMIRLGLAMGAQLDTFIGLTGIGDLILTATDNQSRNRRFGLALGKNISPDKAEKEIHQAIEGKYNAKQLYQLAQKYHVEMPITEMVFHILENKITLHAALKKILSREPKEEMISNLTLKSQY